MKRYVIGVVVLLSLAGVILALIPSAAADSAGASSIEMPRITLRGIPVDLTVQLQSPLAEGESISVEIPRADGTVATLTATPRTDRLSVIFKGLVLDRSGLQTIRFTIGGRSVSRTIRVVPGFLAILPSLLAIILAFISRQVILSLLFGIWLGCFFLYDFNPITGFFRMVDTTLMGALNNEGHLMILIFSLMLGGMVGIISRAGGTYGIVNFVARFARNPRSAQLVTWFMGIVIFFDDYSNTLLVGNTMRPFTDRLRISREKLAYIVDSTAAPVTSIAVITTWIGTEIGLINDLHLPGVDGFTSFINALPYNFYSILAILLVFLVAYLQRDFGPMLQAERRARHQGKVLADTAVPLVDESLTSLAPDEGVSQKWYNAIIPILAVILCILVGLYVDGRAALGTADAPLRDIFGAANSLKVLMWGSFTGVIVAAALALGQRILSLARVMDAWLTGLKSMMIAVIILTLAWSLTAICNDMHTASYVAHITSDILNAHLLPLLTFILAAFIGFATGTSWGTMGILIPIVLPLARHLNTAQGLLGPTGEAVFFGTLAAILSGSVFGDHCSPLSDTTIMSSMASGSDHIDHVRTQLPYAILGGVLACLFGYLPAGFGLPPSVSLVAGIICLVAFLHFFGRNPTPVTGATPTNPV